MAQAYTAKLCTHAALARTMSVWVKPRAINSLPIDPEPQVLNAKPQPQALNLNFEP